MRSETSRLGQFIGYRFTNPTLLEQALTHRSASGSNNERLEFLGDAILGWVIADELFQRFPEASEGQLSRLRSGLVKRETLAELARGLELGEYLVLGPGELRSGGHSRDSILADALEALFAAVHLDGGIDAVRQLIQQLFKQRLNGLTLDDLAKDPKTKLQEYLQSHKWSLPSYSVLEIRGEQHRQLFTVECRLEEQALTSRGEGGSRRKAEQAAAAGLLQRLTTRR